MLEDPYPSAPMRLGQYVLYLSKRGDTEGNHDEVHIWCTPWAAKKFLEIVLDDDDFVMETDKMLHSQSGIIVRCDRLTEVINHEYTDEEDRWELKAPDSNFARNFRYGVKTDRPPMGKEPRPKREKKVRSPQARKAPGMTTISELAEELDIIPREARGILRKAKIAKPYSWKGEDLSNIRALIQEKRKK